MGPGLPRTTDDAEPAPLRPRERTDAKRCVMHPVLYVHPWGHLNDLVVPAGALGAMSTVQEHKLGRYAFELGDAEIAEARVVALDLHWALGLPGVEAIVSHVRRVNPRAAIVLGGISASLWAERLLRDGLADHVVCGDAEPGFARLVSALVAGRDPGTLPNVMSARCPAGTSRPATDAEHDATQTLAASWFPSYERLQAVTARALSHDRVLPVLRGCAMRCEGCQGSHAAAGVQVRSPSSVSSHLTSSGRVRHLVLLMGKPGQRVLADHAHALAGGGPWPVEEHVGIFCCRAPDPRTLHALSTAFPCRVGLSALDPAEHEPRLSADKLRRELEAFRLAAKVVAASERLELVLWSGDRQRVAALRRELGAKNVRVSWTGAWDLRRPLARERGSDFDAVAQVMRQVWTFGAARALSPTLARLLAPFGFLDELSAEPEPPPDLHPRLARVAASWWESWRAHRLPVLPGLSFYALPTRGAAVLGRRGGCALIRAERADPSAAVQLRLSPSARGLTLTASLGEHRGDALAVVPGDEAGRVDAQWLAALSREGLLALALPAAVAPVTLEIALVLDAAEIRVGAGAQIVARARVDQGLYCGPHPLDLVG